MSSTRRQTLAALAALAAGFLGTGDAIAARPRPPAIVVDVSPLRAKGVGPFADLIAASVTRELRARIRLAPGTRLVVRIDSLLLTTDVPDRDDGPGFGGSSDYLEGMATLIGPRGEVLANVPQLVSVPAASVGAWYLPGNEHRRADYIARTFAQWLVRRMPA